MKELKELRQELLDKITEQRRRFAVIDTELLYQYDKLTMHIKSLGGDDE